MNNETKWTPEPWSLCGEKRGGCQCGQIWSPAADAPVADVIHGPWGDTYPSLRPIGSSIEGKFEAVVEMIEYGVVDMEAAKANAARIVACVNALANRNPAAIDGVVKALEKLASGRHIHYKFKGDSDECGQCGLDLRDPIHYRSGESEKADLEVARKSLEELKLK